LFAVGGFSFKLRWARVAFTALCCSIAAVALSACTDRPQDVIDKVRAIDLLPAYPRAPEETAGARTQGPRRALYEGRVVEARADGDTEPQATPSGDGFELSFENAPITTVAKVILGDILGVGYTIDPRVQGTISLASGRPVPRSEVLYVLETALRINNVVLIKDTAGYRLVPAAEAAGGGNLDRKPPGRPPEPGFGITVVPLQHVSAQTLIKLLDSFATKPNSVRADPGRNLLIIQGTAPERRAAVETVLSFDADWMRGQSVGIYPVSNSTPEPLITELEKILDSGEGGLSQSVVKLQPISRLNAILVVTRKPELLRTVSNWISRLDHSDASTTGVKVYRVRYGDARQLARLLNEVFLGGPGTSTLDTAATAPGLGSVSTSSGAPGIGMPGGFGGGLGGGAGGGLAGSTGAGIGGGIGSSAAPSPSRPALSNTPQAPLGTDQGTGRNIAPGLDSLGGGTRAGGQSQNALLPNVRITADVANNALLIYANQESYRVIERALQQLDRPQLQVSIEATIAEVTLNDKLNYGVQFFLKSFDVGAARDKGSIVSQPLFGGTQLLSQVFPGFNFLIGAASEPRLILDALHTATDVKVLSNPSVVVLDNQVATLLVGDQIPITTGTATVLNSSNQVVSTIDYRNTGMILRVIPRINVNGNVVLDIEQEISNVSPTSVGALTPTISQRRVKSSISVASGQTVLLAGLISETRGRDSQGVPFMDQIPALGNAFSHSNNANGRTEIIVFIRPVIIRDSVDAHYVAEELRAKLAGQRTVLAPETPPPPTVRVPLSPPLISSPPPPAPAPVLAPASK